MKKIIFALFICIVLGLVGCGGGSTPPAATSDVVESASDSSIEDTSSKSTSEEAETEGTTGGDAEAESEDDFGDPLGPFQKDANIDEIILYDQNDVKITATGLTYDSYSVSLNLRLENNSDRKLEFIAESMGYSCNAVNGFMIEDGYLRCKLPAGESTEDAVTFNYNELLLHGITEVASIQTGFDISDEEYNHFTTGPLEVHTPLSEGYDFSSDTYRSTIQSKALKYTYDFDLAYFAEEEIYSSGGIKIASEAYLINTDGDRILMLEVVNTTENTAHVVLWDVKVNGTVIYDSNWTSDTITAGKKALANIALDDILDEEEWEEYGIGEVETISFTIEVQNEDWVAMAEPSEVTVAIE